MTIEPNKRYRFRPDIERELVRILTAMGDNERAKAEGTYKAPTHADVKAIAVPPAAKQIGYLKSLGCNVMPNSKFEASAMIDEILREKELAGKGIGGKRNWRANKEAA